jgi:hypothetical protein
MFCHIQGLPTFTPNAASDAWLACADKLALRFNEDLSPGNEDPVVGMCVYMVASSIWRGSGGDPCWSKLDAAAFMKECETLPVWPILGEHLLVTLRAFYCFLAKFEHISVPEALVIEQGLAPWTEPLFERLAAELFEAPAGPHDGIALVPKNHSERWALN